MTVVLDETGMHAESCECMRCSAGYRPSAAERWRARDQLARSRATMDALQKKPTREELRRVERRRLAAEEAQRRQEQELQWRREHPPLTRQQIEELEETKRRMFPALAERSKR